MSLSSIILMPILTFVVAMVLTGLFWKLHWLKIGTIERWDMGDGIMYDMADGGRGRSEGGQIGREAVIEINGFLKFVIPEWMGNPPINYAICFFIICGGLSIIIITYGKFIG